MTLQTNLCSQQLQMPHLLGASVESRAFAQQNIGKRDANLSYTAAIDKTFSGFIHRSRRGRKTEDQKNKVTM